jgi:hypothetical protein
MSDNLHTLVGHLVQKQLHTFREPLLKSKINTWQQSGRKDKQNALFNVDNFVLYQYTCHCLSNPTKGSTTPTFNHRMDDGTDGWMEKASRKTTTMSFTICN